MISEKIKLSDARIYQLSTIIFFLFFILQLTGPATAATYYFSDRNGNDGYTSSQARNQLTPWKSLAQLNFYFKYLIAGDSVLFNRGDVFYGAILVNKSGAAFAPICFGAYGAGAKPEINGLTTVSHWKLIKEGIYESPCPAGGSNLLINGRQQALGRFPNKGYLSFESHQGSNSITDTQLSDAVNWTGAEIVIRKTRWIIDKSTISKQAGGTISFAGNQYIPKNGYGYFIQKSIHTLDQLGEWYYDPIKKSMVVYFGTLSPDNFKVQTSNVDYLVDIQKFNNINFEDISFTGAGKNGFYMVQAKQIAIKNCHILLSGSVAVSASYSPFLAVEKCLVDHSLSGGINLDVGCTNASITDNDVKNTALFPGMGGNGTGTYEAITSFGDNTNIEANRIDSTGYNGIYFGGNSSQAKNNYITYFCLTKDDGAGIYIGDWSPTAHKKVIGNIILNGVGNSGGTDRLTSLQAEGIYIDDNSASVTIADNTVSLCSNNGIKIHNAKDIDIYNNTVFNNGIQLRLEQDHYLATSEYIRNNNIRNNTFFAINNQQSGAKFSTNQDDIPSFGKIDSNVYCRLAKTVALKKAGGTADKDNKHVLFEYNASNKVKTILLNTPYVDVQNRRYTDKIDINPYSSVILIATNSLSKNSLQSIDYIAAVHQTHQK